LLFLAELVKAFMGYVASVVLVAQLVRTMSTIRSVFLLGRQ